MPVDLTDENRMSGIQMREHFALPVGDEKFKSFDAAFDGVPVSLQSAFRTFRHNLMGTVSTVAMPFNFAFTSVQEKHFQRLHIARDLANLPLPGQPTTQDEDKERDRKALEEARAEMQAFVGSNEGSNVIIRDVCSFLLHSLEHGFKDAAQELLHQGLVLLWSAFEVLLRDVFEAKLNDEPLQIKLLVDNPKTRKRFEAEKLPLETLLEHGFDLSARVGTVLVGQQNFNDFPSAKGIYSVLFPNDAALNDALDQNELWKLYQRRHLIVHRRGAIDHAFLNATGETHAIGSQLNISPRQFDTAFKAVLAAGTALASAVTASAAHQEPIPS